MDSSSTEVVNDPLLWYAGSTPGLLVLRAENTLFRVPRKTMEEQSSVFRYMLEFPQPNPEDRHGPLPLIRLSGDSAFDVACFLRALLEVEGSFKPPPTPTDLKTLLAVLRLAHKYEVHHLRQRALQHVATAYPTTLSAWDNRFDTRTFPRTLHFDDEFELLRVALRVGARWAMPTLFYSCGAYPMSEILSSSAWIGAGDLLIEKNLCLQGYVDQFAATLHVLRFLMQQKPIGCLDPEQCASSRLTWFDMVDTWRPSIPLEIWDQSDWGRFAKDVCPTCLEQAKSMHRKARAKVWDDLPKTYGLPRWGELENLRKLDLE